MLGLPLRASDSEHCNCSELGTDGPLRARWHSLLVAYAEYRGATAHEAHGWSHEVIRTGDLPPGANRVLPTAYIALLTLRAQGLDADPEAMDAITANL